MRYLLLKLLPKNVFSQLMGKLAEWRAPSSFLISFIQVYSKIYGVKLDEMESPSLNEFKSFNEFFTRRLKPDVRPVDSDEDSIISPVDGRIAEFGPIQSGLLVQTKGIYYSINDLIGEKNASLFDNGYFVTLYLGPGDYHRIHAPVTGTVREFSYFSGNLWPVNDFGINHVSGLFSINERIVTNLEGKKGQIAVVKVGATIVGKIKTDFSDLASNNGERSQLNLPVYPPKVFAKGTEIGRFQLGSTVILLFPKNSFNPEGLKKGKTIKMGQTIGRW